MKFSSDASIDDPAIGMNFRKQLGDWFFSLQGGDDKTVCGHVLTFILSQENCVDLSK